MYNDGAVRSTAHTMHHTGQQTADADEKDTQPDAHTLPRLEASTPSW